jgi:glycosidase
MGNITGNQDRARFISLADGAIAENENPKQAGWDRDIQINSEESYKKLQNLAAFMSFIPGVPVIYYGDEIGMPGANDPDSSRDMKFDFTADGQAGLSSPEKETRAVISQLIGLRTASMALVFGDCVVENADANSIILKRRYFDEEWYFISINSIEVQFQNQLYKLGVKPEEIESKKLGGNPPNLIYFNKLKTGNSTAIVKISK